VSWLLLSVAVLLAVYGALIVTLVVGSRQWDIRVIVRLVPYCAILFKRLLGDPRVPARWKVASALALVYLAMPFDLVPDFIPGIGYADDAIVVAIALRRVVRKAGEEAVVRNWRGSEAGLSIVRRLAGL
jgi:uncharacterized membrane protein YkvA (DUF1232 family)